MIRAIARWWRRRRIAAQYARLGVPPAEQATYTGLLAQDGGDLYAILRDCPTRAELDRIANA